MADILDRAAAIVEQATPGPWSACGQHRGVCQCHQIWSTVADHPVAVAEHGDWGDDYPELRTKEDGSPEAYMERIVYGSIDKSASAANARLIALAPSLGAAIALAKAVRDYREGWCTWETVAETYEAFVASLAESIKED